MRDVSVIIPAAGCGSRMNSDIPKQYLKLDGVPVIVNTVRAFCGFDDIAEIIVLCPAGDIRYCELILWENLNACTTGIGVFPKVLVREGGKTRQESVFKGLEAMVEPVEYVLVHDGARPFVSEKLISDVINALRGGADMAVPCVRPKSTIRTASKTLDRSSLYEVQTPQGFKTSVIKKAYEKAYFDGFEGTDDASLAERLGCSAAITEGDYSNIKITTAEDMPSVNKDTRCGTGYDVHILTEGRRLMLGCVQVPYEKGLIGHSDADVCSHAVADALLGAAAQRDIGYHFPDTSEDTEGMSGSVLLEKTAEIIKNAGFTIVNIDATIVAQRPKLSPHIDKMRLATAAALGIDVSRVSIKATTEEGLGVTGSGEAIACHAIAMVK